MKFSSAVFIFLSGLLLITGCSHNQTDLLDQQLGTIKSNASIQALTQAGNLFAIPTGATSMWGYGSGFIFNSTNSLSNFTYTGGYNTGGQVNDGGLMYISSDYKTIVSYTDTFENMVVHITTDQGQTFRSVIFSLPNPGGQGYTNSNPVATDANTGYMIEILSNGTANFLKLNFAGSTCTTVSTIGTFDQYETAIPFFDVNGSAIMVLLHDQNNYSYTTCKSTDGGLSWVQIPLYVSNVNLAFRISANTVIYYGYGGDSYYISNDNGETVTQYFWPTGVYLTNFGKLPNGTLYGVQTSGAGDSFGAFSDMYVSTNGGQTWQKQNSKQFYAGQLKMYDNNNGIAYCKGVLQTTADGGTTWQIKLFPLAQ